MALVALMALMLGSFAGLMIGRWAAVVPLAAAFPAAGLVAAHLGSVRRRQPGPAWTDAPPTANPA